MDSDLRICTGGHSEEAIYEKQTLYEILQVLSISIFEKVPVNQLFAEYQLQYFKEQSDNQLKMFDL